MAGLNLDSLKNLWTPSPETKEAKVVSSSPNTDIPNPVNTVRNQEAPVAEKSPITGAKKFSLMSLKKSPDGMVVVKKEETIAAVPEAVVEEVKVMPKISIVKNEEVAEEIVPPRVAEILPVEEIAEETIKIESLVIENNAESISLSIEGNDSIIENTPEVSSGPMKEFFPKLQSLGKIPLHEELDIIGESVPDSISVPTEISEVNTREVSEEVPLESIVLTEDTITSSPVLAESISIETAIPEILTTPVLEENRDEEYVAEVKTELSEQRRAGFRFLVGKKSRIIAGIGIITSLSVVAFVSNSFLSNSIPAGKSNVQEVVQTAPPIEEATPTVTPEIITPTPPEDIAVTASGTNEAITAVNPVISSYEVGRDYSVAKNNKKNTKSKTTVPQE